MPAEYEEKGCQQGASPVVARRRGTRDERTEEDKKGSDACRREYKSMVSWVQDTTLKRLSLLAWVSEVGRIVIDVVHSEDDCWHSKKALSPTYSDMFTDTYQCRGGKTNKRFEGQFAKCWILFWGFCGSG